MTKPSINHLEGIVYDIENGEFPVRIETSDSNQSLGVYKNQDIASQVYATAKGIKATGKLTPQCAQLLRDTYMSVDYLLECLYSIGPNEVDDFITESTPD